MLGGIVRKKLYEQLGLDSVCLAGSGAATCVFRRSVTARFGIVTADFGSVTDHFGDVTDRRLVPA